MEFSLKKTTLFLMIITSLFYGYSFATAAAAELKIGFVNAIKLMETAPQVENANRRLEQEFAPRQRRLVNAQQEIKTLEERLAKNEAIMSETESRKLRRDVREKKRELRNQEDEFKEDYNIRRNEELEAIQQTIHKVIQTLAEEESYDFILSEGVVHASSRVDITDKVLKRLREQSGNRRR
ncbi:MAG: OmpH family outer membrane protein [Thioploca sp.]|nr:OmpH family outer membrane protein [Thioploca sp.]